MTKEELYNFILKNKMAYHRMLRVTNPELYREVSNKYNNVKNIGESFWLYCHNYDAALTCNCGSKLLFENVVNGYKSKLCKPCYNNNRQQNSAINILLAAQNNIPRPVCNNTKCNKPVALKAGGTWSAYCSTKCRGIFNSLSSRGKASATMMTNHGVTNALQSTDILNKMLAKVQEKRGISNVMRDPDIAKKVVETKIAIYGAPSSWSGPLAYQINVDKASAKFGYIPGQFTNVSQIPEVHAKKLKSGHIAKDYILPSGNVIRIQGYENKFLDYALKYYPETVFNFNRNCSIPYVLNTNKHRYIPDFVFEGSKQVIEVKSDYTFYSEYEKNIAKAIGCLISGYTLTFAIYKSNGAVNYKTYSEERMYIKGALDLNNVKYQEFVQYDNYIVDFDTGGVVICYKDPDFSDTTFLSENYFYEMNLFFKTLGKQLIVVDKFGVNDIWVTSLLTRICDKRERIYARKTVVKRIMHIPTVTEFMTAHHIQGRTAATIHLGLYSLDKLVAVMSFSKPRDRNKIAVPDRKPESFELVRYATSMHVIGGASKLLSHFIKTYSPSTVYSYSDNNISTGNMYKQLEFEVKEQYKSAYSYYKPDTNRLMPARDFTKSKLAAYLHSGKILSFDPVLTEKENMKMNGYRRIYDSGKITWVIDIKQGI